jgi:hypothetical protein
MEELLTQVVQDAQRRYYGKYRSFVTDNDDPEVQGRLRLTIPSVLGDSETAWAMPCLPFGGVGYGLYLVPEVGAAVWAEFEEGDLSRPIWTGVLHTSPPGEEMTGPPVRVLRTPGGHVLLFDDTSDAPRVELRHAGGARLTVDEHGSVALTDQAGAEVHLDAERSSLTVVDTHGNQIAMGAEGTTVEDSGGNSIEMRAAGVTVKARMVTLDATLVTLGGAGGEPVLKGSTFLSGYMAHVHPTAWGPSGPPIVTSEATALSKAVSST